jgi:hypothetical protein
LIEKSESQKRREAGRVKSRPRRKPSPVDVTRSSGDTEKVPASRFRRQRRQVEFSLTAAQRKALFAGESPRIAVPRGECPFQAGDVYDIPGTKNLWLGITGVAQGLLEDVLLYTVFDERPRLLRASVHGLDFDSIRRSMDPGGVPTPLQDAAAVANAAEESAYTTSPGAALSGEPEAIHRAAQEEVIRRSRDKRERLIRSPIAEVNALLAGLEDNPVFAKKGSELRFLRGRLARLETELLQEEGLEE